MPTSNSLDVPPGARCFVDANILLYHFIEYPPASEHVTRFLHRIGAGEISAFCSALTVSEALHAIMLAEIRAKYRQDKPLSYIQRRPALLRELDVYAAAPNAISTLGLQMLATDFRDLARALQIGKDRLLLTNDAAVLALMERHQIPSLATNDDDFDNVPGISVHKPRLPVT